MERYAIHYIMLIPSICIIVFLSFLEKRKYRPNKCGGRPALIIPFPSLDSFENRLAYAVAFGTTLNTTVTTVISQYTLGFEIPRYLKALEVLLRAMISSLLFFPYFACISTRYRAVGAVINICYCLIWFGIDVAECHSNFVSSDNHIPGAVKPHQVDHVRWVFRKSKDKLYQALLTESQTSFVDRMNKSRRLKLFTDFTFFKYPTKIVSLVFFQLNVIYLLVLAVIVLLIYITSKIDFSIDLVYQLFGQKNVVLTDIAGILKAGLSISLALTVFQTLYNIFMFTRNYRYHMLKLFQGDTKFLADWESSANSKLMSSFNCVGYVIVFSVSNFFLSFMVASFILILVFGYLYYDIKTTQIGEFFKNVFIAISFPLLGQIFTMMLSLLSRRYLLQRKVKETDKELPLNVDNRKLYEVLSYFYLYLSMTRGIFSCLGRFILSAAFGFFSLGRLDKSIYSRDLQKFDGAYGTYLAMLQVDNAHNNPSVRLFTHLLWIGVLVTRLRNSGGNDVEIANLIATLNHRSTASYSVRRNASGSDIFMVSDRIDCKSKQARTRWFLAQTLINNPKLRRERRKGDYLSHANFDEIQLHIMDANHHFDYNTLA
ncbi:stimulated by retinoic acid gene 6 protein-like isoform X3 [Biomphalaria glabrata]|uniref:Stimulated by retinoic acid gene 6 protein-like isoform X3 n=1 Tax=Biomphalaria glabrata TaxID=6526 RepID=A0A9W2ZEN2_BIOGL|nr:stimulated by retinoic acid gene 6 protein-like isoform X3 [Biomphalaria glabrata]